MKNLKIVIMAGLGLLSLPTSGQGVPKAYGAIYYQGKVNGRAVQLLLADGYLGASTLSLSLPGHGKYLVFEPDAGVADEHNRLKFIAAKAVHEEYFILNHMQEAYEAIPALITGIFYFKNKKIPVRFGRVKQHKS